ncbi:porin, partial [Ralstonia pseudosolanacearum]|uniref:porin n=1 Tax=Ralstonia pseudosolanacearum TaxID=1310165 RepID=UPI003D2D2B87
NGVRYESPSFGGFESAAQVNLGNGAHGFKTGPADDVVKNGMGWGVTLAYKQPEWEVRAIYDELNNQDGRMDNLFVSSRELFLGAKARFGNSLAQVGWSHYTAPDTAPGLSDRADHYWVGLTYDATTRLHLQSAVYLMKVAAGRWTSDHVGQGRGTMFALGAMYDLSKRTFLYTTLAHMRNSDKANFSVRPSAPGYGDPVKGYGTSPIPGQSQTGFYVGMMHNF